MDFVLPPEIEAIRLRIRRFVDDRLIPLESDRANYDEHENIAEPVLERIRSEFDAGRATMHETAATIRETLERSGYLLDPHTATGVHVANGLKAGDAPLVILGTAHPAKFPAAVEAASGILPALPKWLAHLMDSAEKFTVLSSDLKMVEDHISRHARAVR